MLFAIICQDKPDSEALRKSTRADHLAYIGDFDVRLAGPLLSDDGEVMQGSLIILEAADLGAAQAFAAADPYKAAGLFADVSIRPFRQAIPAA